LHRKGRKSNTALATQAASTVFYTAVGLIDTVGCGALFLNNYPALFQKQAVGREAAIQGEYRQAVLHGAFLRCSKQSITQSQPNQA